MGLDMYLTARKYISGWEHGEEHERETFKKLLALVSIPVEAVSKGAPSGHLDFHIGYWRKANAVHRWFVEKIQDGKDECKAHDVSREQLTALKAECLLAIRSPKAAAKILPTQSGFFFGSTDYDEHYLYDLKETVAIVDAALALPQGWHFEYQSSW